MTEVRTSVATLSRPTWITDADETFVRNNCTDFEQFEAARELSQSSIAIVRRKHDAPPLFFKKSCVALLQEKSPRNPGSKWRVTQSSFVNEHKFLEDSVVLESLRNRGVLIPKTFATHRSGEADDFSAVFLTLTECLDFEHAYVERQTTDPSVETRRLFSWLARFHAFFWGDARAGLRQKYLEHGGWWRKPLRPTVKWDQLLPTFIHLSEQFPDEFASLQSDMARQDLLQLGALAKADMFASVLGPPLTLIHGDVKTCNFFLGAASDDVIAIDFQWTGQASSGLGDIVYFFYGGVTSFPAQGASETIEQFMQRFRDAEEELKRFYIQAFLRAVNDNGINLDIPLEQFEYWYDLELLEYFTTSIPYLLSDLTPKLVRKNIKKYGYLTYEFDPRMTSYFFHRTLEAYNRRKAVFGEVILEN